MRLKNCLKLQTSILVLFMLHLHIDCLVTGHNYIMQTIPNVQDHLQP